MRSVSLWTLALGLALSSAHPGAASPEDASRSEPPWVAEKGAQLPRYSASQLDGTGDLELDELRGKTVLLNFWATWCLPCRHEIPVLSTLSQEHRGAGLEVVGVSLDVAGTEERVRSLVADEMIPYTVLLDPEDLASDVFQFSGLPASFLVSTEGALVWSRVGPILEDDPELAAALEEALSEEEAEKDSKAK